MNPLLIVTASLVLHIIGFAVIYKSTRRRRPTLPVIGRDPLLTDALHQCLTHHASRITRSGHALVQVTLGIAFIILFALVILATLTDGPK